MVRSGPSLRSGRSRLSQVHWTCSRASRAAAHPFNQPGVEEGKVLARQYLAEE
jgi:hypothetical protein